MPRMRKIWRVYSGTDGQSHIAEMPLVMKPFVDTEGAHGEATAMQSAEGIAFRVSPPGYVLDWHCAPRRQRLARPRAAGLTERRLTRFVEDVGGIQMDSINVLERAHYLTVWSRFGPYDRARLDRLVYERRLLFEYWAHAACLVPTTTLPWWRRAMLDYRVRHTGWSGWLQRNTKALRAVQAAVRANGPMGNADFDAPRSAGRRGGWWDWKPVQHAFHYLWMTGALTVHSRRHFHKRFDLMERAFPDGFGDDVVSAETFLRWHLERSLHALGAATETDLARYLSFPRLLLSVRRAALRSMIDR